MLLTHNFFIFSMLYLHLKNYIRIQTNNLQEELNKLPSQPSVAATLKFLWFQAASTQLTARVQLGTSSSEKRFGNTYQSLKK